MTEKPYKDKEVLKDLYVKQELTTREIADEMDCSNGTISRWLNNHDIETRENWKVGQKASAEANGQEYITLRQLETGYMYWSSKEGDDRTTEIMYVHRLLAISEYGFDALEGMHVHHKNNIPFDNRPENIELLTPAEHQREHREGTTFPDGYSTGANA